MDIGEGNYMLRAKFNKNFTDIMDNRGYRTHNYNLNYSIYVDDDWEHV